MILVTTESKDSSWEPAEAHVRQLAAQDVPDLLHAYICLSSHLRRHLRVPPPVEDGVHHTALPAWIPPLNARLQSPAAEFLGS